MFAPENRNTLSFSMSLSPDLVTKLGDGLVATSATATRQSARQASAARTAMTRLVGAHSLRSKYDISDHALRLLLTAAIFHQRIVYRSDYDDYGYSLLYSQIQIFPGRG